MIPFVERHRIPARVAILKGYSQYRLRALCFVEFYGLHHGNLSLMEFLFRHFP
jgi:hypothetical protein